MESPQGNGGTPPSEYMFMSKTIVMDRLALLTKQKKALFIEGQTPYGYNVHMIGKRICVVRFYGPHDEERKQMNRYETALQQDGYKVERITETSLAIRTNAKINNHHGRQNREVLLVRKLKPEYRSAKNRRGQR